MNPLQNSFSAAKAACRAGRQFRFATYLRIRFVTKTATQHRQDSFFALEKSSAMGSMKHNSEAGQVNVLALVLGFTVVVLIAVAVFAVWAFEGRQDYKNHSDQKVAIAIKQANDKLTTQLNQQFAEKEKSPYVTYTSPQALGSLKITYPKTWSGYVVDTDTNGDTLLDAYFQPHVVPNANDDKQTFALRAQIMQQSYSDALAALKSTNTSGPPLVIKPYKLPNVSNVIGVMVSGTISGDKNGVMVMFPLRTNVLKVWTEGSQFTNDFNKIILQNLTFAP